MISNELLWQNLAPDYEPYINLFASADKLENATLAIIQPRLYNSLESFLLTPTYFPFAIIRALECQSYLSELAKCIKNIIPASVAITGDYKQSNGKFYWQPNNKRSFTTCNSVYFCNWIEMPQLFGSIHQYKNSIHLEPGLLHKINGGVLLLSVSTLLAQPLMWQRLKQMVIQKQFEWLPVNDNQFLPYPIDSMPLDVKLILVGDNFSLDELETKEPELFSQATYGEYEFDLNFEHSSQLSLWMQFVKQIITDCQLPALTTDAWPTLITQAIRYTEDKSILPLDRRWLIRYLSEANKFKQNNQITTKSCQAAMRQRKWQHGYLAKRNLDDILKKQVFIKTEGKIIGQINGLSIIHYPGHPEIIGEPSRITCVAHLGEGEFTDVERKVELGGNIHAKGMMIMNAYLNYELNLEQPQPFSASIVFEQSYNKVDGDSASLAELCALISALSLQPIDQQIAVTGSVDQFGYVQPIGSINPKIESFFDICFQRELTGQQGVIIPAANIRHLCLNQDLIAAVKSRVFNIWPVEHVSEAISMLTKHAYYKQQYDTKNLHLLALIHKRITLANKQEKPKFMRFIKWLNLK
ncbi:Lon protease [Arsenophonus endosymbiont of Aleurodicus dispersus]|uniref:AAA family ATPase n=1 Tax=Arsenophonus endosymbiont of Aleurodicus dispersus TaxID=235559 RepID=UPI000EB296D3|nr:Lon protease family protein [Arsenophonus endosymbiont of Aleurodicus dispersus]VAY02295.1 Lon protease [Arsenophonus endosymbiont of Aleurodicus dispersus]